MWSWLKKLFGATDPATYEVPSPRVRISPGDVSIHVTTLSAEVTMKGLRANTILSTVQDTGSMDPLIDAGMMIINEAVDDISGLQEGDIIVYAPSGKNYHVMHRIIAIGNDVFGWFCRTKGDNTVYTDPYLVRADWVKYVVRGILF